MCSSDLFAGAVTVSAVLVDSTGAAIADVTPTLSTSTITQTANGTGTAAGDGGWLNVPVAENCTCPLVKFCASAVAGATVITAERG